MGAALALLDNLPQLLSATAPPAPLPCSRAGVCPSGSSGPQVPDHLNSLLLIVFSVCNTLGRIFAGFGSEMFLHRKGTPRTKFWVLNSAMTCLWSLSLLLCTSITAQTQWAFTFLPAITATAGLTFGAAWTLMPATTSELFGLRYFSANYATIQIAPILATAICPDVMGRLYDHVAHLQNPNATGDSLPCTGPSCFQSSLSILFLLTIVQVVASGVLLWRTRGVYECLFAILKAVDNIEETGSACSEELSPHTQPSPISRRTSVPRVSLSPPFSARTPFR